MNGRVQRQSFERVTHEEKKCSESASWSHLLWRPLLWDQVRCTLLVSPPIFVGRGGAAVFGQDKDGLLAG